jgi:multidrug efflux pump subunit AcrA (membrane-fusion protein)
MKRSRIFALSIVSVAVVTSVGVVVFASRTHPASKNDSVPLATVKRGEIDLRVYSTAELRANHAIMLPAPAVGGDALQIVRLVRTGEPVEQGDVIVEFDPSGQQYKLEQSRSELLQAEQEIAKAKADALVLTAEDKVILLKARHNVRRAELDVKKEELVSKIDAEKNKLALEQTQRVLAELERDDQSHQASSQASITLAQEKFNKAKLAMDQAQQNLGKMRVTAPMNGLVSIQKNMSASGGFFFTGMSLPDYHPGDQVQPGSAIAQVVDPLGMDLTSKVSEHDHSNIKAGQAVEVHFDALPDRVCRGTVKTVGGMSTRQFFEANTGGSFDVSIQLVNPDPRLRSGFTAQVVFLGDKQENVLYIPRQAIFLKDGKPTVYSRKGGGYEQREVTILSETESRASIAGLEEGAQVALVDPTIPRKPTSADSAAGNIGGAP